MSLLLTTFIGLHKLGSMKHEAVYDLLLRSVFLGVFATLIMDVVNVAGRKLGIHKGGSYALIGRWFMGFGKGRFRYSNILEAPAFPYEGFVGFVAHYAIGICLGYLYLTTSSWIGFHAQSLTWGLGFGTLTNILPWFIMFPAFGFGILAIKGPSGNTMLRSSFLNHLGYGAALWIGTSFM